MSTSTMAPQASLISTYMTDAATMSSKRTTDLQRQQSQSSKAGSSGPSRSQSTSSSKASSPVETPRVDFQFLNFSHPSEAKTSQHRKQVRSHVTKQQHQREHALNAARRAQSYQAEEAVDKSPIQRSHAATFPSEQPASTELPGGSGSKPGSPKSLSQASSPGASPTASSPQSGVDLTSLYPEQWQPYVPRIMEAYLQNMVIDIPGMDASESQQLLRSRYFSFVLANSAPLHAVLLMATSHYNRMYGSRSHGINLLQLRGMAISEINSALADEVRGTSDQVIAAVAQMAAYEALFGDRSICNTHMQGVTRMVSLRGGLPALGLEGLLEKLLLWIDANVSHITRSRLYFDQRAFPPSAPNVTHPLPDPTRFSAGGLSRRGSS